MPLGAIIVCADDFALHAGVTQAVIELARAGRLSATSAMVLSPRWTQDAAALRELRGRLDVGLHLDWTSDFAHAAGHGLGLGAAMLRAALGAIDRARAQAVVARQLDAFEAHWQAPPDFVDGHQHVQQFAGIRQALLAELARRYGTLARKPYLRVSQPLPGLADGKSRIIAAWGANALKKEAASAGMVCARGLFGIYDFDDDEAAYAARMGHWLAQAQAGAILMCHPALHAQPGDPIAAARVREAAYLASPAFAQALIHAGWRVARGAQAL
ncbi:MAG: ChbG/HpnK family deacetylase [Rhodoferax sp.]